MQMRASLSSFAAAVWVMAAAWPAWAAEDAVKDIALVVPLVLVMGAILLALLAWLIHSALPRSWPSAQRWMVALVAAPSAFGVLVLVLSGPGFLQQWLAPLLLP